MSAQEFFEALALTQQHPGCVRSGYCCKTAPCPYGEAGQDGSCIHQKGDKPGEHYCGKYDEIIGQPGADLIPAFGQGCCSGLNPDRLEILRTRRNPESQRTPPRRTDSKHM